VNKNDIIEELYNSGIVDAVISNMLNNSNLKEDLKAELFLILLEKSEATIKHAHNNNYLKYYVINILKKQFKSNTSPFHKKYRRMTFEPFDFMDIPDDTTFEDRWNQVETIVNSKLDILDRELFKLYWKMGDYDALVGKLKDTTCQKEQSSLRKIEKKLEIQTVGGKRITISRTTISKSLKRSTEIIQKEISK
jgi:hypothetical protein